MKGVDGRELNPWQSAVAWLIVTLFCLVALAVAIALTVTILLGVGIGLAHVLEAAGLIGRR